MTRRALLLLALVALAAAALAARRCGSPNMPTVDVPPPPAVEPATEPASSAPRPSSPSSVPAPAPERLRPYLEKLGRAGLLRDVRRLAELRRARPELFESDLAWLAAQLRGDLFAAAGAAELLASVRPATAVAAIAPLVAEPGRPLLKDALLEQLARAGGDAAAAAIVDALRRDEDVGVRARAARALASFQGPEAYAALVQALKDPAVDVRRAAAAAMASMDSPELLRSLIGALLEEPDVRVQGEIVSTLDRLVSDQDLGLIVGSLPPAAQAEAERLLSLRLPDLFRRAFPLGFFTPGRETVPFDPAAGRRIGLTVELGPGIRMSDVAHAIFSEPPFDRYREWFYLRNEAEFPSTAAYDFLGRPLQDVARGELEGTVYLRFRDPEHFDKGMLGYARGCEAFVQKVSLLHEMGHALARLGDEYKGGSPPPHPNLSAERSAPWEPLIRGGHLPQPLLREEGVWIPSESCHMNNQAGQADFCPPCQLVLMARIAELSGAPVPLR